jgi:hypothetical protein
LAIFASVALRCAAWRTISSIVAPVSGVPCSSWLALST